MLRTYPRRAVLGLALFVGQAFLYNAVYFTFGLVLGFALYASVFALPIFLQGLLGYSAWDTGMVMFPGAIASALPTTTAPMLTALAASRSGRV